jgi:O-acetylserine/cysteine efflux transporter
VTARSRFGLATVLAGVYGVCYPLIKVGLAYAPPLAFAALRALAAGIVLLALLAALRRPIMPPRRLWPGVAALALMGTALGYGAMFSSPGRAGAGLAAVLGNTTPLLTMLLAVPLLGEPLTRRRMAALALGTAGVVLIALPTLGVPSGIHPASLLRPLLAAAGFAAASVTVKRMDVGKAVLPVVAWQLVLGGLALAVTSRFVESGQALHWTPAFGALLLFLAVVGTAATTALWYWLVQRDHVGRLSLALFLAPAVGLLLGVGLLGERPSAVEWVGAAVILGSLGAVAREGRRVTDEARDRVAGKVEAVKVKGP